MGGYNRNIANREGKKISEMDRLCRDRGKWMKWTERSEPGKTGVEGEEEVE